MLVWHISFVRVEHRLFGLVFGLFRCRRTPSLISNKVVCTLEWFLFSRLVDKVVKFSSCPAISVADVRKNTRLSRRLMIVLAGDYLFV
jgi:hypothetical protein